MRDLQVSTVPLEGKNLIEASAGTGKTFSIGILVIRLIIEKELNINEILMVTFTKSAVEELKTRVNKFCRDAQQSLDFILHPKGKIDEKDNEIFSYIKNYCQENPDKIATIQKRMHANVLLLDELNIMTIHGFCQKSLGEFAFESNQLFGAELIQDTQSILENALNIFWRKNISTLDIETLENIEFQSIRPDIFKLVKLHIDGKKYAYLDESRDYSIEFKKANFEDYVNQVQNSYDISFNYLLNLLNNNKLRTLIENTSAKKATKDAYLSATDPLALMEIARGANGWNKNAVTREFTKEIWWHLDNLFLLSQNLQAEASKLYRRNLYCWAIQDIVKNYDNVLISNSLLSYNDLISNMSKAVSNSERFVEQLQKKYKAVFVDEFQDTDQEQYNIFQTTFGKNDAIMFLIGDPKQSIYSWRKADLDTYFLAKSNVGENIYSMKKNFRSGANVINDFNQFFLPTPDFDTFYFPESDSDNKIEYIPVSYNESNREVGVYKHGKIDNGLKLWKGKNKDQVFTQTISLTHQLLTSDTFTIYDKKATNNQRLIQPKDIGIIVRTNKNGIAIKKELSRLGVPCVMLFEQKVLQSEEAHSIFHLMTAIVDPKITNILKVLKTNILNFSNELILHLDKEYLVQHFFELKKNWNEKGIYPTLQTFFTEFGVEDALKTQDASDRIWANTIQISEILNKIEQKQNFKDEELLGWLKKRIDGKEEEGDEYLMRIESDENAVTIITIHKSKGLEYNVVLCPELDFSDKAKDDFITFKEKESNQFVVKDQSIATELELDYIAAEIERENRRLIYVALTRAKSQCQVLSTNKSENAISYFYNHVQTQIFEIQDIEDIDLYKLPKFIPRNDQTKPTKIIEHWIDESKFQDSPWFKLSYTGLAAHNESTPKERTQDFQNKYDEFIFSKLRFGALSGNLLHDILEKIDFVDRFGVYNDKVVKDILQSYLPQYNEEFYTNILFLVKNILNADIIIGNQSIRLNQITRERRLSELEFDFPIHQFSISELVSFTSDDRNILVKNISHTEINGMMNGKIDLLFECEGKYYILDWKSNYLGYKLDDYSSENVAIAMNENNYHLQYMIYAVALKKYLEARGVNFEENFGGVMYLFLRGVRENKDFGIYTYLPQFTDIQILENILTKK